MRLKNFIFLIFLQSFYCVNAQSLYYFQYNFHAPNDTVTYNAFLVRYDDGTGMMRIKYKAPSTATDMIVEMTSEETYFTDKDDIEDTTKLVLIMQHPKFITGDSNTLFTYPVFTFKSNKASGYFEPDEVSVSEKDRLMPGASFHAELLNQASLSRIFALQYFNRDDEFFVNLFKPKSRGGFNLAPDEKNIRIHLLIVADVLDTSIGNSCKMDMERTLQTFDSLRKYMGLDAKNFLTKTISGKDLSKKNVQTAINNLKPSPNDIVIFYYSGHGFRLPENSRRFPNIKLKTFHKSRDDVLNNSLNIEDIFDQIKSKGARLNLVLSDCCNDDIFSENAKGSEPAKSRGSNIEWSETNVRALFLNKLPVDILATAAQGGQRASSNDRFGGFFSFYFKTAMENYSSKLKNNVDWNQVFQDAKVQTTFKANHTYCDKPNRCMQVPDYEILPGK